MTDEEIIKALECCIEYDKDIFSPNICNKCPLYDDIKCTNHLLKCALELINYQQAEIKRLKKEDDKNFEKWNMLAEKTKQHYANLYNEAKDILKSEAIKEFAEKLKNKIKTECNPYGKPTFDYDTSIAIMRYIDNLVKEMVGE